MKILAWGAAVSAVAALVACGGSNGGNSGGAGGGSGGGGTTTSTSTTVTSSSGSTNTTTSTGSGGSGPACGILWEDPNDAARAGCETCMEDSCCTEMSACAAGTDCDALLTCVKACADGDSACTDTCINGHMQGYDDYNAMFKCYDDSCKATQDCEYPICDSMLLFPDQKCAECLGADATCCGALKDCGADQTCAGCAAKPDAAGCDTNALYQPVGTCFNDTCGKQCSFDICGSGLGYQGFPSCNYCLTQQCCTEFDACQADATCNACLGAPDGADCATNAAFTAFTMCRDVTCKTDCGG